jgi:hypothetical protein
MAVAPTATTRPLWRQSSAASWIGRAAVGGGGHDGEIDAVAAGRGGEDGIVVVAGGGAPVHAEGLRLLDAARVEIDAVDAAAVREQQLDGQLADQAEADDGDDLAEGRRADAEALHRDRAEGREGGLLERQAVRNVGRQVLGDDDELGVVRIAGAGAGDAVAGDERMNALADGFDDPGARITEGLGDVEAIHDRAIGRERAFLAQLAEDLLHEIGAAPRLAEQRLPREVHRHLLGPGREDGERVADEDEPGTDGGGGDQGELEGAGARVLEDLLHASTPDVSRWPVISCPARRDRSSPHARRRSAPSGSRRAPLDGLRGAALDLADADVFDAAHGGDARARVLHRPTQLLELSLVEAHEAHGDEVDGDGIGPGDHGAERDVVVVSGPSPSPARTPSMIVSTVRTGAGASRWSPVLSL